MAFRDEGAASRARIETLEAEVSRLTAENATLRRGRGDAPTPWAGRFAAIALLILAVGLAAASYRVAVVGEGETAMDLSVLFAVLAAGSLAIGLAIALLPSVTVLVPPNRIAVIIGRVHRSGDSRGYRIVRGGRVACIPLLETCQMLPAAPFTADFVGRVRMRGDESAEVRLRGHFSYPSGEHIERTVERYLGKTAEDVAAVARDALDASFRALAAQLDADQLTKDQDRVVHEMIMRLQDELDRVGLHVDTIHILDVRS